MSRYLNDEARSIDSTTVAMTTISDNTSITKTVGPGAKPILYELVCTPYEVVEVHGVLQDWDGMIVN